MFLEENSDTPNIRMAERLTQPETRLVKLATDVKYSRPRVRRLFVHPALDDEPSIEDQNLSTSSRRSGSAKWCTPAALVCVCPSPTVGPGHIASFGSKSYNYAMIGDRPIVDLSEAVRGLGPARGTPCLSSPRTSASSTGTSRRSL